MSTKASTSLVTSLHVTNVAGLAYPTTAVADASRIFFFFSKSQNWPASSSFSPFFVHHNHLSGPLPPEVRLYSLFIATFAPIFTHDEVNDVECFFAGWQHLCQPTTLSRHLQIDLCTDGSVTAPLRCHNLGVRLRNV